MHARDRVAVAVLRNAFTAIADAEAVDELRTRARILASYLTLTDERTPTRPSQ